MTSGKNKSKYKKKTTEKRSQSITRSNQSAAVAGAEVFLSINTVSLPVIEL